MVDLWNELGSATEKITIVGVLPLRLDSPVTVRELTNLISGTSVRVAILCESDSDLFNRSLSLDTPQAKPRYSFSELKFRRDLFHEIPDAIDASNVEIKNSYSPISLYLISIDNRFYCAPVTNVIPELQDYILLKEDSPWYSLAKGFETYLTDGYGSRFTASPDAEVIELYDQQRAPRGLFPRSCFYDTDYHQYVIWDFIFDRNGNLLIHQRSANAKDNRGMWDKSVGGHVDWSREMTSARAAVREMIEELFEDELNKETMAHFTETEANIVYLGDWRPEKRGRRPLEEIRLFKKNEWAYFSLREQLQIDTPRHFEGGVRQLRVIADVFLFVASTELRVDKLKNSQYRLVRVTDLKSEIDLGQYTNEQGEQCAFEPAPDLRYVMAGPLREILEKAAQSIRFVLGD